MAKRKKRNPSRGETGDSIGLRPVPDAPGQFELVYPKCVRQREEDMEEVRLMLEAGELDVALDELRWLLSDCRALLEAHQLLGQIARAQNDLPLARSHYGYAYELGLAAIPADFAGRVLQSRPANGPFFEAGRGLAGVLAQQGDTALADEVRRRLTSLDPKFPFDILPSG